MINGLVLLSVAVLWFTKITSTETIVPYILNLELIKRQTNESLV